MGYGADDVMAFSCQLCPPLPAYARALRINPQSIRAAPGLLSLVVRIVRWCRRGTCVSYRVCITHPHVQPCTDLSRDRQSGHRIFFLARPEPSVWSVCSQRILLTLSCSSVSLLLRSNSDNSHCDCLDSIHGPTAISLPASPLLGDGRSG